MHRFLISVVVASTLIGCKSDDACIRADRDPLGSEEARAILHKLGAESLRDIEICRFDDFAVARNTEGDDHSVLVLHDNEALFFASKHQNERLSATVLESGRAAAHLADMNGDGSFDALSYDVKVPGNTETLSVFDGDLDGQTDWKVMPSPNGRRYLVWVQDGWYDIATRDGSTGALVDGEFVPISNGPEGWKFETP